MNEITVRITDDTGATSTNRVSKTPKTAQKAAEQLDPKNEAAKKNKEDSTTIAVASLMASRAVSYCTSNVGKWTGNSRNQDRVNMLQQGVGTGMSAIISPYLTVAMAGMQIGTTAFDAFQTNRLEAQRAEYRRLIAGYSSDNTILGGRK